MWRNKSLSLSKRLLQSNQFLVKSSSRPFDRFLFTQDFLGVNIFLQKKEKALIEIREKNINARESRSQILNLVRGGGQDNSKEVALQQDANLVNILLGDDVRRMIYTTNNKEELIETKEVLRYFVLDKSPEDSVYLRKKAHIWKDFMSLCHNMQALDVASDLWKDEEFLASIQFIYDNNLNMNMSTLSLIYLDMLYQQKRYDDVIKEVERLQTLCLELSPYIQVVAMMSCLQLNTPESMKKASKLYAGSNDVASRRLMRFTRLAHPYAMLACLQGNYGLAYEALSFTNQRNIVKISLLIHVLCKLNRLIDAVDVLDNALRTFESQDSPTITSSTQPKVSFPLEVVKELTKTVEKVSDKALKIRVANIFRRLDRVATISNTTLLSVVTQDIDCTKSMLHKREKNQQRIARMKSMIAEEEADEECDDENEKKNPII